VLFEPSDRQLRGFFRMKCFLADKSPHVKELRQALAGCAQDLPTCFSLQNQEG
jgi:hypothetical protein